MPYTDNSDALAHFSTIDANQHYSLLAILLSITVLLGVFVPQVLLMLINLSTRSSALEFQCEENVCNFNQSFKQQNSRSDKNLLTAS